MSTSQGQQQQRATQALRLCSLSFRLAGLAFLALGIGYLFGLPLKLPFDSYTYYLVAFCGCLMVGMSLILSNAISTAGPKALLLSAAITMLLFAGMRIAYFAADPLLRGVAGKLLVGEIVLFSAVGGVFLVLRKRI